MAFLQLHCHSACCLTEAVDTLKWVKKPLDMMKVYKSTVEKLFRLRRSLFKSKVSSQKRS